MRLAHPLLLALLLLGIVLGSAAADVREIPVRGGDSRLTLLERQDDALIYSVQIGRLVAMDVETPEGPFTRLMIPEFHCSKNEGSPELPMMNRLIEIPHGARASVEVVGVSSRSIDLGLFGIENRLLPAQPSMPKSADPAAWPFVYDRQAYNAPRVAQDLVAIASLGRLRAVDVGRLEVSPVEYFPAENRIVVYDAIEFRVRFEGADHAGGDDLKARTNSPFFEVVYERLDGYRGIHENYPDRVADVVTMVILTPPEFEAQIQSFVDWKVRRGFHVVVGVLGTPEVGTTTASIQAYIRNLYQNGTPELPAPSFVLFIGDVAQMPTWTLSGDPSDRPYCAIDADLVPEIYYGRWSATNPSQLQAILDKTMMYDQFTMPDPSYLGEVLMIAGMDASHGSTWANGQINYGTTYYFNQAHGILSHTYLYPQSGGMAAQIIADVSHGVGYANYTAHGSETSWADPYFGQSDVNNLTNYGKYPLVVGNCCSTSDYAYGECFAETWLRAPNKGAIGYIGGSNSTYWDEDYWWGVGYKAVSANPPFDPAHMGTYDGLFHDHGEAMAQWYVTSDALIFCGNLAVMESGSSRITYYWNIYNLMGDPSLTTYLGVPEPNSVLHPATIFTTWATVPIEAVPGSYVGLTKDGELIGAGTVGETGAIDLPILADPLTPGTAHLVVMMQNREPYQTDINVIVPATVYIDPDVIDANVETPISVGVFEYDGSTPKPGIEVWAEGLDYESGHAFTETDGYCEITVDYPYGPTLDIVGKDPAEPWELFRVPIQVNALSLTSPDLWVTTSIGLVDSFALNLPGTLHAQLGEAGATLWAFQNGASIASTTDDHLDLTPGALGVIRGLIALSGYDLYAEEFPVIEAFGTLSGHVDAGGSPAVGAVVKGYDGLGDLSFQATTNAQGNYAVGDEILCALYTVEVDFFGFEHWEEPFFVNYGANVLDIALVPAPSGVLSGTVLEDETDLPLAATIKVYRSDTMGLYAEAATDPLDGTYTTPALPYFDYVVIARSWHHIPETVNVTVAQPVTERNFWLDVTNGDFLVINDQTSKEFSVPAKLDEKTGEVLAEGLIVRESKGIADLLTDLENIGYTSTVETMSATNPATWSNYDLLIVSSGGRIDPLANAAFRSSLISFVDGGGHLLIEGGEVGYDFYSDSQFAPRVLHINDWDADQSGNVTVAAPAHYIVSVPNTITGPIAMSYVQYGDQDALDPTPDAVKVCSWTSYAANASVIAYDPNPAPQGGQIAFYAFNYSTMDAQVRPLLLQNTLTWLMEPEAGDCSVSGRVFLAGQSDFSGVRVEATPNGGSVVTGPTGEYSLPGLFAGPYTIRASKDGFTVATEAVVLAEAQQMEGVNFVLLPVQTNQFCRLPNLSIPDSYPTGVTDPMPVLLGGGTVSGLQVYVRITHTYIGDLIVRVQSPSGTTVTLHNRTGGTTDNLVGWYPSQLTPAESLDRFIGEPIDGVWKLFVSDNAGADVGTLNEWCLRLTYGSPADAGADLLPLELDLAAIRPNPTTSSAVIRYALPAAGPVDLGIFDVSGRRVATLAAKPMTPGRHDAIWDGRDDAGRFVASGLYFCRLEAGGRVLTRKLLRIE